MVKFLATFEVLTPMFCGDGEPENSASIRPLSIKGLLRFHFRAVAYGKLEGNLTKVKEYEDLIFGTKVKGGVIKF